MLFIITGMNKSISEYRMISGFTPQDASKRMISGFTPQDASKRMHDVVAALRGQKKPEKK
jgi:hypothetical protein